MKIIRCKKYSGFDRRLGGSELARDALASFGTGAGWEGRRPRRFPPSNKSLTSSSSWATTSACGTSAPIIAA